MTPTEGARLCQRMVILVLDDVPGEPRPCGKLVEFGSRYCPEHEFDRYWDELDSVGRS